MGHTDLNRVLFCRALDQGGKSKSKHVIVSVSWCYSKLQHYVKGVKMWSVGIMGNVHTIFKDIPSHAQSFARLDHEGGFGLY